MRKIEVNSTQLNIVSYTKLVIYCDEGHAQKLNLKICFFFFPTALFIPFHLSWPRGGGGGGQIKKIFVKK